MSPFSAGITALPQNLGSRAPHTTERWTFHLDGGTHHLSEQPSLHHQTFLKCILSEGVPALHVNVFRVLSNSSILNFQLTVKKLSAFRENIQLIADALTLTLPLPPLSPVFHQ